MSSQEMIRGFFALLYGGILAWGIYERYDPDMQNEDSALPDVRWSPILPPWLLPFFLVMLFAMVLVTGAGKSLPLFGGTCLNVFVNVSIYYVMLIAAGPLLRRLISARACAALWLLPNLLYICECNFMHRNAPKWIIRLRGNWLRWAVMIWLIGAAAVLAWKFAEHFAFRRRIRNSSVPERNADICSAWADMQRSAKIKKAGIPILRSEEISSPLSVGLFPASTFVVLPDRDYGTEETALILRHELIHIVRRDAQTKLLLALCTAVCWFNPLIWAAAKRCSEDLELSCDELVLENAEESEKKRYADLILSSAGESKGFTSSLAPGAKSLRYRLRQIMNPGKRLNGGIAAGLILFLMLISSGMTAFAYGDGPATELAFGNDVPEIKPSATIDMGTRDEYGGITLSPYLCTDTAALMDYIADLRVCRLCGSYDMEQEGRFLEMFLPGENGPKVLFLEDKCLKITDLGSKRIYSELWYLDGTPDWDYVRSLLEAQNADAVMVPPQPPVMEVVFGPESVIGGDVFTASGKILENTLDGLKSDFYEFWESSPCGVEGLPAEWAEISFPGAPDEGCAEVSVTAWSPDRSRRQDAEWDENGRIKLLPESARYIVNARWEIETELGTQVYRMEYEFDVIIY